MKQETSSVSVVVRPGMQISQKLVFSGKGNEQPKQSASDLIVSFSMQADKHYSRKDTNDLIYRHKVSLVDVIQCKPVKITTLDGR